MAPSKKIVKRSNKMIFTLYPKWKIDWEKIFKEYSEVIRFIIANPERCPTGENRFHWQGYIQFFKTCRYAKFHKIIGHKCFMKIADGTTEENIDYCSKLRSSVGEHIEFGKPTMQGQRNDLLKDKDLIDEGGTMYELAQQSFSNYIRYHKGYEKYKNMVDKQTSGKRRLIETTLLFGKTGMGKTKYVLDKHGDDNVYIVCFENKSEWWDGYEGEDIILFDDYNNNLKIDRLLRLLDIYKCRLPVKCGFTWAKWHKVYITTNLKINEIHSLAKPEHRNALFRRIQKCICFDTGTPQECAIKPNGIKGASALLRNKEIAPREIGTKCCGNINTTLYDLDKL